jgi:hypothetical protein
MIDCFRCDACSAGSAACVCSENQLSQKCVSLTYADRVEAASANDSCLKHSVGRVNSRLGVDSYVVDDLISCNKLCCAISGVCACKRHVISHLKGAWQKGVREVTRGVLLVYSVVCCYRASHKTTSRCTAMSSVPCTACKLN